MSDAHQSGYHGATGVQWSTALRRLAKIVDVVGFTECRRRIALPKVWDQYLPGGPGEAECSVAWNTVTHRLLDAGTIRLTRRTFKTGKGAVRNGVIATWVLLLDLTTGELELRVVIHFPASVQHGDKFSDQVRRVAAWVSALAAVSPALIALRTKLHLRFRKKHGRIRRVTLSADFNVDLKRARWRRTINAALAPARLQLVAPTEGTHRGGRAIDGYALRRPRKTKTKRAKPWRPRRLRARAEVLPATEGFDHDRLVLDEDETARETTTHAKPFHPEETR